jgi:hypothetical protein
MAAPPFADRIGRRHVRVSHNGDLEARVPRWHRLFAESFFGAMQVVFGTIG